MRKLGEKSEHEMRAYENNVPRSAQYHFGENVRSPLGWQRITAASGDRVEQGNTWWVPVRISLPPVGT